MSAVRSSVSVVMVTYHTGPVLFDAIDAVLGSPEPPELILVDNGNPPDVVAKLTRRAEATAGVELHTGQGNVGFAAACNVGARGARGELLLFLNPDCVLPPDGIEGLLDATAVLPRPWLAGARIVDQEGREVRGSRRAELTPATALTEAFRLDRVLPAAIRPRRFNAHTEPRPATTTPVPVVSGACMLVPAADYWSVGGMDDRYFLHVEDIDLCTRFRNAGGVVYHVPTVAVRHVGGTSEASAIRVEWHKTRGFVRFFGEHHGRRRALVLLVDTCIIARFALKATMLGAQGLVDRLRGRR